MRQNITGGRAKQGGGRFCVDLQCQCVRCFVSSCQSLQNGRFPGCAVIYQPLKPVRGICHRGPVTGVEYAPRAGLQLGTGRHEISQIPIGGGHQRTGPPHHMIGGKTGIVPPQTDMIADVARCVQYLKAPVLGGNDV